MRFNLFLSTLLIIPLAVFGQHSLNSGGTDDVFPNATVSHSLGQLFDNFSANASGSVHEGVQQVATPINYNPKNAFVNSRGCVACELYSVADSFSLDSGASWYTVVDSALLVQKRDNGADLTKVCVSLVDNMSQLFLSNTSFNQDISGWDVSNVTDMSVMFGFATAFNQDIGNWDVGNVNEMSLMFYGASAFDQDLSGWCVSNVPSLPVNFSTSSPLSTAHYPSWGTCPCILTLDLGPNTVSVCDTSYVLDAGYGYNSYLWSTGDTTQSIEVNTTGNFSCTVSDGNCSASDTVYVSLLYAPISASDSLVCAGDLVTLAAGTLLPDTVISQLGLDIDGETAGDYSGSSVSLSADGQTLAIGAYGNDGNGSWSGHVRIYSFNGSTWSQLGQDIDGEAANDNSGRSVSLSANGQTVAIGASRNDDNGTWSGHVRIYSFNGSTWSQLGQDIAGESAYDWSGHSVSLSADGQIVAIGANGNDGNGASSGHVRIYSFDGLSWSQIGQDIDGEAADDRSGWSVSLSSDGQTVAIGAPYNDGNGFDAGHVRIYSFNGSSWIKLGQDIDGEVAGDLSGWSVSLSADGRTVAIGALEADGNSPNTGHTRVYQYLNGSWNQLGLDIDGEAGDDWSGVSVSLSADGQKLAIGARFNDGNGDKAGHVRIYSYNSSSWIQVGQDIDGEAVADKSGSSVSLASDGKTVAIGADSNNGNGTDAGHVRVYGLSSASPFNFLWSTGDTTQSISVSPTQPTTYFCTISDGNGSCIDSVFIDMPISVDSILALDANKGVYKAYFSGLDPSLSYDLQFKSVSDILWRSKTIHYPGSGQQKFNLSSLFNDTVDVRIVEVAGEEGCISSLVTPCKNMSLQLAEQESAFCAGDSALVRVIYAGGRGAKSILWSNGATTKRTHAQQGETLSVTVTDAFGCSLTDSITASTLSTATAPTGLTITRFGAIISAQWNASTLSSNQTLLGYKLNFRLRNTQTWTKSALISGTSTVLNWTGSGIPAGNYEFVVFARYRENGVAMNSNFSCKTVKGYNGVGGKSDISDASDNSQGAVPTVVYPNPADDFLYVQSALGSELRLLDMQGKMITQMISTELETTLDLSALAQGVYMLEIHSQGGTTTERVVKR